jgi:hypothetical protein
MSARGHRQTLRHPWAMSALPPKADKWQTTSASPLCAICVINAVQQKAALFDHLVGAGKERRWDSEAEGAGGLEVDYQLEPRRLKHRKIAWICSV